MPYVIEIIYTKTETSEKPIFEIDSFPENLKTLKTAYGILVEKPALRANNGSFKKITANNEVILQYSFETEQQARNFYSIWNDNTNIVKKKTIEMANQLPKDEFSQTTKAVVFKNPNGEILSL
jgi:hypothetical protein